MNSKLRWLTALLALSFAVAACGSDDGDDAATETDSGLVTDAEETEPEADEDSMSDEGDDAMSDEGITAEEEAANAEGDAMSDEDSMSDEGDDAMSDEGISDDEMAEDLLGDLGMLSFFWPSDSEPSAEVIACIEGKDVDPTISPFEASEDDILRASVAITGCAPSEMAESLFADVTPPLDTNEDDVKCVMFETFDYMGSIPIDDAVALAGTGDTMGPLLRAEVSPLAEEACNLSPEQIEAIFEA